MQTVKNKSWRKNERTKHKISHLASRTFKTQSRLLISIIRCTWNKTNAKAVHKAWNWDGRKHECTEGNRGRFGAGTLHRTACVCTIIAAWYRFPFFLGRGPLSQHKHRTSLPPSCPTFLLRICTRTFKFFFDVRRCFRQFI